MKKNILATALGLGFVSALTLGMVTAPTLTNEVNQTSVGTEDYEGTGPSSSYDYENMSGIMDDAEAKANNGNTSVYILQRSGIFITVQYLLSIFNVLQINPKKEIYILIGSGTSDNEAIRDINGQHIEDEYLNVNYSIVDLRTITDDIVIENVPTTNDIDLYIDSQTTYTEQENIVLDLEDLGIQLNSITFATDGLGTVLGNPAPGTQEFYVNNNISYEEISSYDDEGKELFENGTMPTQEESEFMHETIFSYSNIDLDDENEFQMGGITYDQYTKGNLINVTNEIPVDLENAGDSLSVEKHEELKYVYNVDTLMKPIIEKAEGHQNIIYSGIGIMENKSQIDYEINVLSQVIDYYNIGTDDSVKLLYKPHPREWEENFKPIGQGLQKHLGQTPTETPPDGFVIVPQQIPLEILGLAHIFENSDTTTYEYILSGTSTTVGAGGSAGITESISFTTIPHENSSFAYFPEENLFTNLQGIYGEDSEVYDGDIMVSIDESGNINFSKPSHFNGMLFHSIFGPIFASAVAGSIGFYFYGREKKNKQSQS